MADLSAYDATIEAAAREWGHDPNMLRALILQESGGNPRAVSPKGAYGLTGIQPDTGKGLGITDLKNETQQIFGAAKYLAEGRDKEGSHEGALLYYHGGPDWRSKYGKESAGYVPGVAAHYTALKGSGGTPTADGPSVPSDDEFLKQAAPPKPAAADAVPSDDEFLKQTGAAPGLEKPAPATPPDPYAEYNGTGGADMPLSATNPGGTPNPAIPTTVEGLRNALAPPAGYRPATILPFDYPVDASGKDDETRSPKFNILAPFREPATGLVNLLNSYDEHSRQSIGTPMSPENTATLFGLAVGGGLTPSVARGTGRLITQTSDFGAPTSELYGAGGGRRTAADGNLLANFPRPTDQPGAAPNMLDPNAVPTMTVRPGMGGPEPAAPAVPNAAGAQASTAAQATMTPAEIAANRHNAEMEWLNKTNQPGVADNRELVQGVSPTLAQREQTVQTAREQKSLSQQSQDVSQEERALADEHNLLRTDHYKAPDLAGSSVLLENGEKAAKDKIEAGLANAFANKTKADASPVVALADETLSGRSGKRAAIETEVKGVRDRLFDKEGNLETDPEVLYGVREHINDILSKENQRQNPVSGRAQSVLIKMRDKLDEVIDPAAPGFKAAIDGFADDMKPLDVMRALQERESGLFDSLGRMQFSRVHSLMRDVIEARRPGAALSPFQHLTDEQMAKLQNLHDDLKRVASSEDLARAKGSDTAQNLWDAGKSAAKGVVVRAANMTPVLGPALRRSAEAYAPIAEARHANALRRRGIEMLHPDPAKYPLRNPLDQP